jgi:hypothetical protein
MAVARHTHTGRSHARARTRHLRTLMVQRAKAMLAFRAQQSPRSHAMQSHTLQLEHLRVAAFHQSARALQGEPRRTLPLVTQQRALLTLLATRSGVEEAVRSRDELRIVQEMNVGALPQPTDRGEVNTPLLTLVPSLHIDVTDPASLPPHLGWIPAPVATYTDASGNSDSPDGRRVNVAIVPAWVQFVMAAIIAPTCIACGIAWAVHSLAT